jgi:hypothetical protein
MAVLLAVWAPGSSCHCADCRAQLLSKSDTRQTSKTIQHTATRTRKLLPAFATGHAADIIRTSIQQTSRYTCSHKHESCLQTAVLLAMWVLDSSCRCVDRTAQLPSALATISRVHQQLTAAWVGSRAADLARPLTRQRQCLCCCCCCCSWRCCCQRSPSRLV